MGGDGESWLWGVLLVAARTVPMTWLVPAFGGPTLPRAIRVLFGVALAILASPAVVVPPTLAGWMALALREAAVGTALAFVVACAFRAAEAAGWLVEAWPRTGASLEGDGGPSGAVARLYGLLAVLVFLEAGGLGHLVAGVVRSYDAVPLGGVVRSDAVAFVVIRASGGLIASAVALAAPVIVTMILVDLAFALVGRVAPQLALPGLAVSVKPLAAVGVVLVGFGALEAAMARSLAAWSHDLARAWEAFR